MPLLGCLQSRNLGVALHSPSSPALPLTPAPGTSRSGSAVFSLPPAFAPGGLSHSRPRPLPLSPCSAPRLSFPAALADLRCPCPCGHWALSPHLLSQAGLPRWGQCWPGAEVLWSLVTLPLLSPHQPGAASAPRGFWFYWTMALLLASPIGYPGVPVLGA